jgi:LPXTG-site transpeptidase (sortase) family protein
MKRHSRANLDGVRRQPRIKPAVPPKVVEASTSIQRNRTVALRAATTVNPRPDLPKQSRSKVLKRQIVGRKGAKIYRPKHRLPFMTIVVTSLAVMLGITIAIVVIIGVRAGHPPEAQAKLLSVQTEASDGAASSDVPTEDASPDLSSYHVEPEMPRYFMIEKLGVSARVLSLGLGLDNILKAPANIYDVGWYNGSAKPGSSGTTLLDGHVAGPTKHGVFYDIKSLQKGDKVVIERGDGKRFTYTVAKIESFDYDKVDMSKLTASVVAGKPGLNFMTATGRFNVRTNSYEQRVAVYTVQD